MTTVCTGPCNKTLDFSCFNKRSASKDGLQSRCRSCQYLATASWKSANKERNYQLDRKWVIQNRDKVRENSRSYYQNNRDKELARSAEKRVKRNLARPASLTKEQSNEIKDFYWLARDLKAITGEEYHVDHIVPLNGKNICGLHVPWNLQVLPADINLSKGNRYDNLA